MHGPAMPGWLLVALCVVAGAYCLARTRSVRGAERRAALDEALMGFGMAVMAVPAAAVAPPEWAWVGYAVVFGAASLRALWSALGGTGHHLHHLVGSLAMVYMALAMAGGGAGAHTAHGAHGTAGGVPLVTGLLLAYYTVYVLVAGARLAPAGPAGSVGSAAGPVSGPAAGPAAGAVSGAGGRWAGAEVALACRVAMGLAMLAMLAGV
ncbi:DUF5134 domain-containing protein [Streptomyces lavendofoliae]|uniref:DUF5134 domain-containing protein n=1 Tax=Streptomyces lavendofoliae TaxID=67314 RepID=A0A918I0V1_9ACTN|nr:DUF5134 domain-containing protein [Streptomyces lavendofoliae]GGU46168.1 hypothetical protein GCM10010274_38080 [Streptomyces lavendofoliae]